MIFETLITFLTIENNNLNIHSDPWIKSDRDNIRNSCDVCAEDTVYSYITMHRKMLSTVHKQQRGSGLPFLYCFRHNMEGNPLSLVACAFILPVHCARARRDREGCPPYVACWTKECNYDLGHSGPCYLHSAKCKTCSPLASLDYLKCMSSLPYQYFNPSHHGFR